MLIAAGPFTLHGSLAFEPLHAVVALCTERRPSLLVLSGPFVDASHPTIATGQLDVTFEELFASQVVDFLMAHVPPETRIVMLPSPADVHVPLCFPQPPMAVPDSSAPGFPLQLPNPALFSVNELVVGVVSVDVLRHLSSAEFQRGCTQHRLVALASHLVQQGRCVCVLGDEPHLL